MKYITRTIWILSLVSLFTDISSEMLYPVMPVYLKTIGFSVFFIGILEGFAEGIAGIGKGYFGSLSDQTGKRLPFVQLGYFLSGLSKPLIVLMKFPVWIFLMRSLDRTGKGLRTGARDAMLSAESTKENKAKVFGFHRGMDTLGAAIGPTIALVFLYFYPGQYFWLFVAAALPALVGVVCTLFLKEKTIAVTEKIDYSFFRFFKFYKEGSKDYRALIAGLLLFTLFNSSDVFLLLMLKNMGWNDTMIIGVYIFYNLSYAVFSYPVGVIADKVGLKPTFIAGLFFFVLVYFGFNMAQEHWIYWLLFFLYGLYAACTEGVSKAWITNITGKDKAATAIGFYASFNSIAAIIASVVAGFIWDVASPDKVFLFSSVGVAVLIVYFLVGVKYQSK